MSALRRERGLIENLGGLADTTRLLLGLLGLLEPRRSVAEGIESTGSQTPADPLRFSSTAPMRRRFFGC